MSDRSITEVVSPVKIGRECFAHFSLPASGIMDSKNTLRMDQNGVAGGSNRDIIGRSGNPCCKGGGGMAPGFIYV